MYSSCAISTCNLPSWLLARWAKISRISAVRSMIRTPRFSSKLRCCAGLIAWLNTTQSARCMSTSSLTSSALPLPMYSLASGDFRVPVTAAKTSPPALLTSRCNSSIEASKSPPLPKFSPTIIVRIYFYPFLSSNPCLNDPLIIFERKIC